MKRKKLEELAGILDDAARTAKAVPQLSLKHEFDVDEAYDIQAASIARREKRGEKRIGVKMGFTSRAKMAQMGLNDMIWGRLTDGMLLEDGGELSLPRYVHPRVEPEICFLLKRSLTGAETAIEAMACVEALAPAIEVIDSRYKDFKFSLEDVIADNASSSGLVVGSWRPADTDIANLGMILSFDGRAVQIGSSAAILGNPARSLAAAGRLAREAGVSLGEGDIVMAGGATAAEALLPNIHVRLEVEGLGTTGFSVRA